MNMPAKQTLKLSPIDGWKGGETCFYDFDSINHLTSCFESLRVSNPAVWRSYEPASRFHGDHSEVVVSKMYNGDDSLVHKSDEILSKIESLLDIGGTSAFRVINSVSGGAPHIGAYLSGHPRNMRLRRKVVENTNPLDLYVDITVSGSLSSTEIINKGITSLTIARILSRVRPVNLYLVAGLKPSGFENHVLRVKVDTDPLDLARSVYLLTANSTLRKVAFAISQKDSDKSATRKIRWLFDRYDSSKYVASAMAKALGSEEFAVVNAALYDEKSEYKSLKSCVGYVAKMVNRYAKTS